MGDSRRERLAEKKAEDATVVVRWERFLPKMMVLRVLLVESDDSTRHIIAALLRKCSYKVVAVGDGLKAWDILKGKSQNIDLILTEVDLPSISGYALLSLIKEHDICKNTPVIMMSSQDSVSTVYKCMLRGAADFLVKPVRINELRNLWQHVWRRQASDRNGPQEESVAQEKMEATAENNDVSTPSSGYVACVQRNKECIEKGSDAQSSCTKPDMEAETVHGDNPHNISHMKINSPKFDTKRQEAEECVKSSRTKHANKDSGKIHTTLPCEEGFYITIEEDGVVAKEEKKCVNTTREDCNNKGAFSKTCREAIDFMGAFDDHSNCKSSGVINNKFDSSLILDLSLRRSHPSGSVNQDSNDKQALNHSDASAFSRYMNRVSQPLHSPASTCNQQRDYGNILERHFSDHALNYNSDTHSSLLNSQKNIPSSATGNSRQVEVTFPGRQQTVISLPIPVGGVRVGGPTHGSVVSPTARIQSELSPVQFPGSALHQTTAETRKSQQVQYTVDQNCKNSAIQAEFYQMPKLDMPEDPRNFSSANDQSASSSFFNGTSDHLNSIGCENNGSVNQIAVGGSVVESGNNEGPAVFHSNYQRNIQREAALNKFRLKRKERCFDKKVRYESRKKLAEQRPRVKGQFVRQVPASVETNSQCGYSLDG